MSTARPSTRLTVALALVALACGALAALAFAPERGDAATKNYIQVSAREYYYGLSKTKVKPGSTTFEIVNYGEDDHDLAVRRVGSSSVRRSERVKPGKRARLTTKLRRGTYILWCTIDDHLKRGMKAKLKVRR